jgi:multidrug efflux pump
MFVILKPLAQRKASAEEIIGRLRKKLGRVPGATLFLQSAQEFGMGGRQGNAQYQYTLQADDLEQLRAWETKARVAMSALPELVDVNTDAQERGASTYLVVDRDAAARLGVSMSGIDTNLNNLFGQRQVSTIFNPLNQYRVVLESDPIYSESPESLRSVYVSGTAADGTATVVPLAAIARIENRRTALSVNHQGQFAATTISFGLAPNVALTQATAAIERAMAAQRMPTGVHGGLQGEAKAFQESLSNQPLLILTSLLAVYIVLGILYESHVHPLTILSTLPSAGVGALLALLATGTEFSIIALIGVILLIGIVKKNAIMMIDFAIAVQRNEAKSPTAAIYDACIHRFRPIMMTTMAALFGALPLAFGTGSGSELRRPLGISIAGGLIVSQLLTLYTTPVVYLYLDRFQDWLRRLRRPRHALQSLQPESGR